MDNMNIRKINGFTVQLVADGVYAIDEFGIALMYLIIGKTQALLLDTGVGAGKTTLVKLLCGLLDPTEGLVLLNGKDVRGFNRRSYYDLFSAVFQEFSVLDVTVAEEIAQTTEGIDYDKIADCVEKAGLTTTIEKLPKGMQTHVGREVYLDGVLFSGGQTQRLMLARALYKDGPILLLDEPTSALDNETENLLLERLVKLAGKKTLVLITHSNFVTRFCTGVIRI